MRFLKSRHLCYKGQWKHWFIENHIEHCTLGLQPLLKHCHVSATLLWWDTKQLHYKWSPKRMTVCCICGGSAAHTLCGGSAVQLRKETDTKHVDSNMLTQPRQTGTCDPWLSFFALNWKAVRESYRDPTKKLPGQSSSGVIWLPCVTRQ